MDPRVPPATTLTALNAAWTLRADKRVLRDGVATNGNGSAIWLHDGKLYVRSPTGYMHWWQWLGTNLWKDVGADLETEYLRGEVTRLQALLDGAGGRVYLAWAQLTLPQAVKRAYLSFARLRLG